MPRRALLSVCCAALALPLLGAAGCKSSGEPTTGGSAGGPLGPPVAAEQFCKELSQIVCEADQRCCDGGKVVPPVTGTGSGGNGGSGGGSGGMEPPPPPPPSCLSSQVVACDATAGKLVMDPRTGYDPAKGGDFLARVGTLAEACWKEPIPYEAFVAAFSGTGAPGADCTPDELTPPSLRATALSCKESKEGKAGAACRLTLRADGKPQGTCEERSDEACSHALDCPSGRWCDLPSPWSPGVWGSCRPLRAAGWKCAGDLECESANCGFDGKCAAAEEDGFCVTRRYSSVVLADAPVAYYRLAEASGSSAADASENAHPGTRSGSPDSRAPGALAGDGDPATSFDGKDDKITVSASLLDGKTGLALEGWILPAEGSAGLPVLSMGDSSADGVILAVGKGGDTLEASFVDTDGQTHAMASAPGTLAPGKWTHVVLSYDGSHGILYLDGGKAAELAGVFTPRAGARLGIGATSEGMAYFIGAVDEVAVYGAALSPARVARHHSTGASGPVAAAWRFFQWLK